MTNIKYVFVEQGSSLKKIGSRGFGYEGSTPRPLEYFDFEKCKNLTIIGAYAFRNTSLKAELYNNDGIIKLPDKLKEIGTHAFNNSFDKNSIIVRFYVPSTVEKLGVLAIAYFSNSPESEIYIGEPDRKSALELQRFDAENYSDDPLIASNRSDSWPMDIKKVTFYTDKYNG